MANGAADTGAANAGPSAWTDPLKAFNFKIEIMGVTEGHFAECYSLGAKVEPIEYRQGGINQIIHHLPGLVRYDPLVLKYGLTRSDELFLWFQTGLEGRLERKSMSVVVNDSDGTTEVMRWNLSGAWISEWTGAHLNALGNETAIAKMVIVYDELSFEAS